jgi:DnaJ-class molecular chaperone
MEVSCIKYAKGLRANGDCLVERGGYVYGNNCYDIFDNFFMESNPFFDLCTDLTDIKGTQAEIEGSFFGTAFGGMKQPLPEKLEDIHVTVECTLQEYYSGSRKSVEYKRQVLGLDGHTTRQETASVEVFVQPGMEENRKMTIAGQGNQQQKREPTDLHIQFKLKPSEPGSNASLFSRKDGGNDLVYCHKVSLVDALQCKPINLHTLDGRRLLVAADSVLAPGTVKIMQGEGMPVR